MGKRIVAICGSTRNESSNMGLLLSLGRLIGNQHSFKIFNKITKFPHFSPDLNIPEVVEEFKNELHNSDILIISTPEYVHGVPGVLKNTLDWIVSDEMFPGKKVGLIIASSDFGDYAKASLTEILRTMSADLTDDVILSIPAIRSKVNRKGEFFSGFDSSILDDFLTNLLK